MRAKMSCPRSSVPIGWFQVGVFRRAVKSMSLIATFQTKGPNSTSATISSSTIRLATAILWRLKRRQASAHGEVDARRFTATSAEGDAGIEPAIEQVCQKVEQDHEAAEHEGHG